MSADSGIKLSKLLVDGGMAANDLMMQMQADFLGKELQFGKVKDKEKITQPPFCE